MKCNEVIAIIPAAGIGKRMKSIIPKQYIMIAKKTIIEHTINTLLLHPKIKNIIVVLNKKDKFFKTLIISKNKKIITVIGGNTRCKSVFLGLKQAIKIKNIHWILIHDAVRPCVSMNDINKLLNTINTTNIGSIIAVPIKDTVKYSKNNSIINYTLKRNHLWLALTPQLFPKKLLFYCLQHTINNKLFITDESSALEYCGYLPKIVLGRSDNIKITIQDDLKFAEYCLKNN